MNNSQEKKVIGNTLKWCCLKLPPAVATRPAKCSLRAERRRWSGSQSHGPFPQALQASRPLPLQGLHGAARGAK